MLRILGGQLVCGFGRCSYRWKIVWYRSGSSALFLLDWEHVLRALACLLRLLGHGLWRKYLATHLLLLLVIGCVQVVVGFVHSRHLLWRVSLLGLWLGQWRDKLWYRSSVAAQRNYWDLLPRSVQTRLAEPCGRLATLFQWMLLLWDIWL